MTERAPRWARAVLVFGLVLAPTASPSQRPTRAETPTPGPTPTQPTGRSRSGQPWRTSVEAPLTYLVVGTDSRGGGGGWADAND